MSFASLLENLGIDRKKARLFVEGKTTLKMTDAEHARLIRAAQESGWVQTSDEGQICLVADGP